MSEMDPLECDLDRICGAEDHITHYAYGRTPDEQVGQFVRQVIKEYRLAKEVDRT